ncbi:MAG: bifunctional oligoribonuclease/PAP phosphatase NrnA [Acetatifactor sp.]
MTLDLIKECEGAARIGISGHVRPDGDCVGAVLGLQMYLKKCLPETEIKVFLEQPAEIFRELKGFGEIVSDFPEEEAFDVFFVLDTVPERIGEAVKYFEAAKKTINIDHHISNVGKGDVNYIRPQIGSTCELIYDLVEPDRLDKEMAMAIYTGMIHDTGIFQYSNTSPETLKKGANLISYGFDFPKLILETFYQRTYVQSQIMGRALMESIRFMDNRCIVSSVDRKTMEFYEATPKDLDGIVNQLRNIKGIECAIFMYQTDTLEYKVSMRSSERVDVSVVAAYFGGGGHARAAGCIMRGTFYDCVNNLSLHIAEQLEK